MNTAVIANTITAVLWLLAAAFAKELNWLYLALGCAFIVQAGLAV